MKRRTSCLAFAVFSGACMGTVEEPWSSSGGSAEGPSDEGWGPAAQTCEVSPNPGRVVAHRLSRTEYNNTLRDLFGFDVGRPADDFPDDVTGGDAGNNNGLIVSDLLLEKAEIAVSRIALTAVQRGFITCDPTKIDKRLCFEQSIEPFMTRAWRRPVTTAEVDGLLGYLAVAEAEAGLSDPFKEAMTLAIEDVLLSPNFFFRFEILNDPTSP